MSEPGTAALAVEGLEVAYTVRGRRRRVLRDLSFTIGGGESFGLVGESGCGKSTAAMAVVRHLAENGRVGGGSIRVAGEDVLAMDRERLRRMRAQDVSMVYQEPGRALNPTMRVGDQLREVVALAGVPAEARDARCAELLGRVQFADPERIVRAFPHMLSGGMQQRVVIAMAIASNPSLLILDEPTTALDATVGAEVLDIVAGLRDALGTSVLLISHNLALVARICDRVGVLYAGALVEEGPAEDLFSAPRHPYTVGLLRCIPRADHDKRRNRLATIPGALPAPGAELEGCVYSDRCPLADARCRTLVPPPYDLGGRSSRCFHHDRAQEDARPGTVASADLAPPVDRSAAPFIVLERVSKTFHQGDAAFRAVDDVSMRLWPGETLGLVGESGSGKTTLARIAMGLVAADTGSTVEVDGMPPPRPRERRSAAGVRALQIVFQNPDAALNRRHTVRRILLRSIGRLAGLRGAGRDARLRELAGSVALREEHLGLRPSRLSGGLKQRVAIARAFAGSPGAVICDEPTSALDVSVQAAILNLLADLQARQRVAYLFISHDLAVVQYIADRVMVMYLGQVMEVGPAMRVLHGPNHPYTEALLSAVPSLDDLEPERVELRGELPSARNPPPGCVFQSRCPHKIGSVCETERPALRALPDGHEVRCHLPDEELPVRASVTRARSSAHLPSLPEETR